MWWWGSEDLGEVRDESEGKKRREILAWTLVGNAMLC